MFSFLLSIVALFLGYVFYGAFVDRMFGPDPKRPTPAVTKADGVDFIQMPSWRVFMVQFLNIAGTGPIFGAIMGAKFGPSSYLWIVLGCIFAGAVHDYMVGMMSLRRGGVGVPELVGDYMSKATKVAMLIFSLVLLALVGTVFVYSPALILGDMAGDGTSQSIMLWVGIIFLYYVIATLLPIDKLIGKIYPVFAVALLFMAVALMVCLFVKWPQLPEIWDGLTGWQDKAGLKDQPIFPCLFITIACGAISGFHATQSPMMARCLGNEKQGRPIFYGAMITEGLVALIWAAVSSWFFFDGGAAQVGSDITASAPTVVTKVSQGWLGVVGGILAVLGVVAAPITSGDTAFRSARLIIADFVRLPQKKLGSRLVLAIPLFALSALLLWYNISDANGFNVIWRYFGWSNQALATIMLWTATTYLLKEKDGWWFLVTYFPAVFMTAVCFCFILVDKIGFGVPQQYTPWLAALSVAGSLIGFHFLNYRKNAKKS